MKYAVASVDVQPVSRLFKALSDETRLRIVALLCHGELCVCHIEAALGLTQPNASRHFAILRSAGIVKTRRDGKWLYHSVAPQVDEDCRGILRTLVRSFARREVLQKDVERLLKTRGPGSCA